MIYSLTASGKKKKLKKNISYSKLLFVLSIENEA